jgi:hypothetical protein
VAGYLQEAGMTKWNLIAAADALAVIQEPEAQ